MSDKNQTGTVDALDALSKIKSLLSAAMHLGWSDEEKQLSCELLEVAHNTAARVLEECQ